MGNRLLGIAGAFVALYAAQCAFAPSALAAPRHAGMSAAEIFDRALTFVREQNYPPYVSFVVTVDTQAKGRWLVEQFSSLCRARDDRVSTTAKPLSTTNHPDNPYRFNLKVKGLQVHDSPNIDEPLGIPEISPIYDFGLSRVPPVTSSARSYEVALVDEQTLRGRPAYLLELTPLGDPKKYRVREMWVDVEDFSILQLTTDGAFAGGPGNTVAWTVSFAIDHGHWLIENEATTASLVLGGYAPAVDSFIVLPGSVRYEGISYTFSDFEFPKTVSDLLFLESKPSQAVQQ
ncbi:MAG: hypothetical protein JO293_07080 [Candidatus Eremiobacteraeota bacterium]|nr:hypothetical protein [Candidatus Eremiobacteraeota bacterium]MBV8223110.1 hypothetical protein [Candidatus Eremiobacteraeota bacterium]